MDQPPPNDTSSRAMLEDYLQTSSLAISPEKISALLNFCALILRWNRLTSLVQANTLEQLVQSHVIDCLAAIEDICGPNIVDVGSGAGFPGIVFAIVRPEWHFYLVETNQRRARFLTQAQIELSLKNVSIVNSRIEHWEIEGPINCLTSRAYSALAEFFGGCRHLVGRQNTVNPKFVALKGRIDPDELAGLVAAGISSEAIEVKSLQVPGREHRHVVIFHAQE